MPCRTGKNTAVIPLVSRVSGGVTRTRSPVFFSFTPSHGTHVVSFLFPKTVIYFLLYRRHSVVLFRNPALWAASYCWPCGCAGGKICPAYPHRFLPHWKTWIPFPLSLKRRILWDNSYSGAGFFRFFIVLGACGLVAFIVYRAVFCCSRDSGPPARTFFSARRVVSVFQAWRPPWPARYGCLVVNLWGCSQRQAFYLPLSRRLPPFLSKTDTEPSHRLYISYLWLPTLWLGVSVLLPFVALRIAHTLFLLSFFPLPPGRSFLAGPVVLCPFRFFS